MEQIAVPGKPRQPAAIRFAARVIAMFQQRTSSRVKLCRIMLAQGKCLYSPKRPRPFGKGATDWNNRQCLRLLVNFCFAWTCMAMRCEGQNDHEAHIGPGRDRADRDCGRCPAPTGTEAARTGRKLPARLHVERLCPARHREARRTLSRNHRTARVHGAGHRAALTACEVDQADEVARADADGSPSPKDAG